MGRLSLYKSERGQDYKFFDRNIYEQFQVGGVDVHVYKYIGPVDPSDPSKALGETTIQDVVLLENRDRLYDTDIYVLRGHYRIQDIDFNLSQFGIFLQNDVIFMTIHINNSVDLIGRKIMVGDVFELPHLKDEYAFNDYEQALKKYYVVESINRAAEGFAPTWYPHLYRVKLAPLVNTQEYQDILNRPADEDVYAGVYTPNTTYYPGQVVRYDGVLYTVKDSVGPDGTQLSPPDGTAWTPYTDPSLIDMLTTRNIDLQINQGVIAEAEKDARLSGYDTTSYYTLSVDPTTGKALITTADSTNWNASNTINASNISPPPIREGYTGYLLGDGIPPNGPLFNFNEQFGYGIQFPPHPYVGDNFLRIDYLPNRLFRFDGARWVKQEDDVRMTMTQTDTRQTLKTSFVNNTKYSGIKKIGSDVVLITDMNTSQFTAGELTVSFEVLPVGVRIVTNLSYNAKYHVEAFLDEKYEAMTITVFNSSGLFGFTIDDKIYPGTRIRYAVYDDSVKQQQFPSKALLNLAPTPDT